MNDYITKTKNRKKIDFSLVSEHFATIWTKKWRLLFMREAGRGIYISLTRNNNIKKCPLIYLNPRLLLCSSSLYSSLNSYYEIIALIPGPLSLSCKEKLHISCPSHPLINKDHLYYYKISTRPEKNGRFSGYSSPKTLLMKNILESCYRVHFHKHHIWCLWSCRTVFFKLCAAAH